MHGFPGGGHEVLPRLVYYSAGRARGGWGRLQMVVHDGKAQQVLRGKAPAEPELWGAGEAWGGAGGAGDGGVAGQWGTCCGLAWWLRHMWLWWRCGRQSNGEPGSCGWCRRRGHSTKPVPAAGAVEQGQMQREGWLPWGWWCRSGTVGYACARHASFKAPARPVADGPSRCSRLSGLGVHWPALTSMRCAHA